MRKLGVVARGIRGPIIHSGDDIVNTVCDSVIAAVESENITLQNKDVVAVTESVVARAQNNYISVDDVAEDIKGKCKENTILGVWNPIFSRNRFSIILRGLARGVKEIHLFMGVIDEVGNVLRNHPFTGINYDELYKQICEEEGCICKIFIPSKGLSSFQDTIDTYENVLIASIREQLEYVPSRANVFCLKDICCSPKINCGYNTMYGLLGSNKASETTLKLFPRDCHQTVYAIQDQLFERTSVRVEVMVYGDGAFKDPVGGIWEFADPVVSPGYTSGLEGSPSEIKLKYVADTVLAGKDEEAMKEFIRQKDSNLVGNMVSQGTTPRQYTDLLGSLCDLVTGSGDKGTPFVLVQGYFDNYSME